MKSFLLLPLFLICFSVYAQRNAVKLYLKIKKEDGTPAQYEEVILRGAGNNTFKKAFTDTRGNVSFSVKKENTYVLGFQGMPDCERIDIPKKSPKIMSATIIKKQKNKPVSSADSLVEITLSDSVSLAEYENAVRLHLKVTYENRQPADDITITVSQEKTGQTYTGKTDDNGLSVFNLPGGYRYEVQPEGEDGARAVDLTHMRAGKYGLRILYHPLKIRERMRNDTVFQVVPENHGGTVARVFMKFFLTDLYDQPLKDENIYITGKQSKLTYSAKTNSNGRTYLLVHKGDCYYYSFEYDKNIDSACYEKNDREKLVDVRFKYLGSKALEKRKAERARLHAIRDSLYKVYLARKDSLMKLKAYRDSLEKKRMEKTDFMNQLQHDTDKEIVKDRIRKRALAEAKALEKDPDFFVKAGYEIQSVLYRMRSKWTKTVVVTDLTGSMYPYMDQLLVWHALKIAGDTKNVQIFFNDGDDKKESDKAIGQTGGIYGTNSILLDSLLEVMYKTISGGYGGEAPENDLEALLEGAQYKDNFTELILIADNYSDVRDLELLTRLNVPVRVILYGVSTWINEQYLEIACKTKGSVHTIEKDITELYKMADGEEITIGPSRYVVQGGKFLLVESL